MVPWRAALTILMLTGCAAPGVPPASSVPAAGAVMATSPNFYNITRAVRVAPELTIE